MILKNEEDTIERCLTSVQDIVDEIIIIDTGSTDRTKELCQKFTPHIHDFQWIEDFAAARNYSFSKATKEYILWLDADDVLLPEDVEKLVSLKETLDPSVDSVTFLYNVGFDEFGKPTTTYRRNRLVKRANNYQWHGFVHEYLAVSGKVINSDISVTHKKIKHTPKRNLELYRRKLEEGVAFTPRDLLYYANELYDHRLYEEALRHYSEFLDSKKGWFEDNIKVCGKISDYYLTQQQIEEARRFAFKCFEYDTPRAEACCRIGFSFLQEKRYKQAAFWYEMATKLEKPKDSWGFFNDACWTWLPHLQLCVCYDKLGDHQLAYAHNEMAAQYRPDYHKIQFNREYFKKIGIE